MDIFWNEESRKNLLNFVWTNFNHLLDEKVVLKLIMNSKLPVSFWLKANILRRILLYLEIYFNCEIIVILQQL